LTSDGPLYEAEDTVLDDIRDKIFSLPLLPQQQVVVLFGELDDCLGRALDILWYASNFVERYLVDVIADVAASVTHGRTIYGGARPSSESAPRGPTRKVFKRASDIRFLERAINIVHGLAVYRDDPSDPHKRLSHGLLRDVRFVRLIYEEVLGQFRSLTDGYVEWTGQAARLHQQLHGAATTEATSRAATQYATVCRQLEVVEQSVGVPREHLYHVCRRLTAAHAEHVGLRDRIYQPYLRIAYKEAKKHATNDQQTLENFQNGAQGLLRAISCYDLHKNVSFSSYAHWWVRQAILFHIKDSSNFVKLPVTTWQTYTSVEKRRAKLSARDGDESIEALARVSGHSVTKLKEVYEAVRSAHVHSLDYEVDDSGKMMLVDVLPDERDAEAAHQTELRGDIDHRFARLTPPQRWVLALHYGLLDMLVDKAPLATSDVARERLRQTTAR
jgi:RNA polymerase sigma factor (sigma-70 family)